MHSSETTSETHFLGFKPLLLSYESRANFASSQNPSSRDKHCSDSVLQQETSEHGLHKGDSTTSRHGSLRKSAHSPLARPWNIVNSLTVSKRSKTRFPLATSSNSDEGERLASVDNPVSQNQAIPLQSLECYNVSSAQGVVCKAECHHESSAVFEASDSEEASMNLTPANTIDDIVSQYAEPSPHNHSYRVDTQTYTRNKKSSPTDNEADSALSRDLSLKVDQEPLKRPINALTLRSSNDSRDVAISTQVKSQMSSDMVSEGPSDESDDNWTRSPRSSRCGFLTPSKMRFRLTSRASPDRARSSRVDNCSPASLWDPLASPVVPRQRQRPGTTRHLNHKGDPAPALLDSGYRGTDAGQTQASDMVHSPRTEMSTVNSRSTPVKNLANDALCSASQESSRLRRLPTPQLRALTVSQPVTSRSTIPGPQWKSHALPSSSLLPRDHLRYARVHNDGACQSSTFSGSRGQSRPLSTSIQCSEDNDMNSSQLEAPNGQELPDKPQLQLQSSTLNSEEGGLDISQRRGNPIIDTGMVLHRYQSSSNLAGCLATGQDGNDDSEVSRFLRNSRLRLPNPSNTDSVSRHCEPGSRIGFKMTGSSLADYSSESTPEMRAGQVINSGHMQGQGQESDLDARVIKRTSYYGMISSPSIDVHGGSLSSLSGAHTERGYTVANTNTSASLLSRKASFKCATRHVSYGLYQCPSFPLTEEQLALRLGEAENIPYERLERLKNGGFLEKAWCFVHKRSEFNHSRMVKRGVFQDREGMSHQRTAARLLIVLSAMTYFVGGFVLVDNMSRGGPVSQCAVAEVMRWLSRDEVSLDGVTRVLIHPADARLAQRVVKAARGILVGVLLMMLGVFIWAAADS